MNFYAHSKEGQKWQPLEEHLRNVAELASLFAQRCCPSATDFTKTARVTGLLHDLGKYRGEFQKYLQGQQSQGPDTAHAMYGAAAAWHRFQADDMAFATAGHHSGLHDCGDLDVLVNGTRFQAKQRYPDLLLRLQHEVRCLPSLEQMPTGDSENSRRRYEFAIRMLFSLLVDADRLDAEQWDTGHKRNGTPFSVKALLPRLHAARSKKAGEHPPDALNLARNRLFDACIAAGENTSQGFFTLTVPTGGGKTLSSMAFALAHARRHNLRRVIVVIPYLSIIEQNAKEYREILGSDNVVEHHSAVETPESAGRRDDWHEPAEASPAEKAMENWDAPIIVTTSVQFIETLFARSPARVRKLHNVARSVVVFDEVQTLPTHLLEPTLDVIRELRLRWGVSVLFCSATQPAFRRSPAVTQGFESGEVTEIAPDPGGLYRQLQRVTYRIESQDHSWDWPRLAQEMIVAQRHQALCVLNLRRQTFEAWKTLQSALAEQGMDREAREGLFHLSSAMCPAHRLDIFGLSKSPPPNNVLSRLRDGKPCWVISTQLIEAGVDVDFPVVFRAMGPLDSIVQAAGRCNREGLLRDDDGRPTKGQVIVFHPADGGLPRGIYERATSITPDYLDPEQLAGDPSMFARYFGELYQISPTDHIRKGEHTIQQDRAAFNFRTVAEHARVIKDDSVSVIVSYDLAVEKLVCRVRGSGHFNRDTLRSLQRYMVNVRRGPHSDYEKLKDRTEPLLAGVLDIPVLDKRCYDEHLGVVVKGFAPEDLIA